jgi:hypothetical protein
MSIYISLGVIGPQENIYILGSLGGLGTLGGHWHSTLSLFHWQPKTQGNHLRQWTLKVIWISCALYPWRPSSKVGHQNKFLGGLDGFVEGFWPSRIFCFVVVSLPILIWLSIWDNILFLYLKMLLTVLLVCVVQFGSQYRQFWHFSSPRLCLSVSIGF